MGKLMRILKHRWLDETDAARALGRAALARLVAQVTASETRHSGQIRLCVEAGLPLRDLWRGTTARQRAVALFSELRVWDTEHNSGVLIYLLLAERAIEIVADRGLTRRVPQPEWDSHVAGMRAAFRGGRFEEGLTQAIAAIDTVLIQHFPRVAGQSHPNELPDAVILR